MEETTEHKKFFNYIKNTLKSFGSAERMFFYIFVTMLVLSTLLMLSRINSMFLVEVPTKGGTIIEGVVGTPRFINPLLAIGDTDKAISNLIYSGLLKFNRNGSYVPDLAESYSVSDDGLSYHLKIREGAKFHDNKLITVDDVLFTIEKALDPIIKSQKRSNWEGVTIEKLNDREIVFHLKKPYSPFLENLTLGILPKHIWQDISPEEFAFSKWNLEPIGSGPYKIDIVEKDGDGITTDIKLKSWGRYYPEEMKISKIEFKFFQNTEAVINAYKDESIDAVTLTNIPDIEKFKPIKAKEILGVMPRIFAAFFNQNKAPLFSNIEVRRALDQSIDKQMLLDKILGGYGRALSGPTPLDEWQNTKVETPEERVAKAKEILTLNGWKENSNGILEKKTKTNSYILKFTISTSEVADLKKTAEILAENWRKLGAEVDVKIFEASDLGINVIKPRNYEILLFGEVVGREMDLYPFWHSSERNDPGLNISLYANITVDKLLEEEREAKSELEKEGKIKAVREEIEKDVPAIFLYAPKYIYLVSPKIKNVENRENGSPSERFIDIDNWYIETNKIWEIFKNN